jgi:hypothetical protein
MLSAGYGKGVGEYSWVKLQMILGGGWEEITKRRGGGIIY